jgi:hypothetical protein
MRHKDVIRGLMDYKKRVIDFYHKCITTKFILCRKIILENYAIHMPKEKIAALHKADEPQPKKLTGENRANREGNDWGFLFSFLISVCSVFSVVKNLCFFAHILLVRDAVLTNFLFHKCSKIPIFVLNEISWRYDLP